MRILKTTKGSIDPYRFVAKTVTSNEDGVQMFRGRLLQMHEFSGKEVASQEKKEQVEKFARFLADQNLTLLGLNEKVGQAAKETTIGSQITHMSVWTLEVNLATLALLITSMLDSSLKRAALTIIGVLIASGVFMLDRLVCKDVRKGSKEAKAALKVMDDVTNTVRTTGIGGG